MKGELYSVSHAFTSRVYAISHHNPKLVIVFSACALKHDLVLLPLFLHFRSADTARVLGIALVVGSLRSHATHNHKLEMGNAKNVEMVMERKNWGRRINLAHQF